MTDLEIRDALGRATEHLVAPPDLLDRVRRGGRRKLVRRRTVLLAGLGAAAAAVPLAVWRSDLTQPAAQGDLGGDQWFLRRARGAWDDGPAGYDADGPPRVVWALNTPAGPVALLRQPVRLPGGDRRDLHGWVGTERGRLTRADGEQLTERGRPAPSALLAGRPRNVLVVVGDVALSTNYTIDKAGRIVRTFAPARLVQPVPTQLGLVNLALRAGHDRVPLHHFGELTPPGWVRAAPRLDRVLPGGDQDWELPPEYGDPYGYHTLWMGDWNIRGATPDGRRFVVRTLSMDGDTRTFYFLDGPQPHLAGTQKTDARPFVMVELPGKRGVVVAMLNATTMRYRSAGGTGFRSVSGDAALLPAGVTAVELPPR